MASKIEILDNLVANQIAAGEVIERPASVVKELIENSIDAGSTRIQVEIEDGGRKLIRVLDNGEGIAKDDVILAFERHATSKIREASDLFSIRTLGFRGEALPSIAAVSKVTVKTRTAEDTVGSLLRVEGGELREQKDVGMAVGTDFTVEDIFFNTPARYKYLKTVTTELGQISDIFNRIALAEPQIAMTLTHNGKLISRTPGTDRLQDTILSIFGRELVDSLLQVEHEESYVQVSGYITDPTVHRSSRKHQVFFVNDRYVRSSLLSRGVDDGYANLLPPNKYPIVFLSVNINPIHVDVNVHPAKFEVKFSRPEIVMDTVTKGIRRALLEANLLPTFKPIKKIVDKQSKSIIQEKSLFEQDQIEDFNTSMSNSILDDTGAEASIDASRRTDASVGASTSVDKEITYSEDARSVSEKSGDTQYVQNLSTSGRVAERMKDMDHLLEHAQQKNWDPLKGRGLDSQEKGNSYSGGKKSLPLSSSRRQYPGSDREAAEFADKNTDQRRGSGEEVQKVDQKLNNRGSFIAELLPIGQIHQTYIIAQGKDGFYVLDQHVVHERILYEELMKTFRTRGLPSQTLLIPLTLELTLKEIQAIQENSALFDKLGFAVEHFGGNTVIIRAVPGQIDGRPDKDLFLEIVDLILEDKNAGDRAELYKYLITTLSCKGAIKAGEHLEQGEMIRLLQELSKTENPLFCPHGRPILFHISEHDLLKAFQRI